MRKLIDGAPVPASAAKGPERRDCARRRTGWRWVPALLSTFSRDERPYIVFQYASAVLWLEAPRSRGDHARQNGSEEAVGEVV